MEIPKYIVFRVDVMRKGTSVELTNITDEVEDVIFKTDRKTEPITHDDYIESENDYLEARCLNCNNAKACKEKHWDGCVYEPKYEGNCSEIPNNCKDLQDWKDQMWTEAMRSCGFNVDGYRQGQPTDEPQTDCAWREPCGK